MSSTGPLHGVRVVELGVWIAGPGAGGLLAGWGADVIKVEPPSGDPARGFGRMLGGDLDVNPVFELDNRGKRSIALDLCTSEGREIVDELLAAAHGRRGDPPSPGSGLTGPGAARAAYDVAAYWARAGVAEALRAPGGPLPFQRGGMGGHTAAVGGGAVSRAAL